MNNNRHQLVIIVIINELDTKHSQLTRNLRLIVKLTYQMKCMLLVFMLEGMQITFDKYDRIKLNIRNVKIEFILVLASWE